MTYNSSVKVCVIGAAGGIGQPLSLLIKNNHSVQHLSLYDVSPAVAGVATDLSHIDTPATVSYHTAEGNGLAEALEGCDFVLIPAGVPRKPGMTRDDLFKINASICAELAEGIATNCPNAMTLVISNPVNSTVPVFAEIFKKHGTFNPRKLMGVTHLDAVRADRFLHDIRPNMSWSQPVKVVGGHSGDTIVPLFSSVLANNQVDKIPYDQLHALVHRVQYGGDEVIAAKKGAGSSTLSMAYAASNFFNRALNGYLGTAGNTIASCFLSCEDDSLTGVPETKQNVKELTGVDVKYFAMPCVFGPDGIDYVQADCLTRVHPAEKEMLQVCCETLPKNYAKGIEFVRGSA